MIRELNQQDVLRMLPARKKDAYKGCFGKDLLLCGSVGFTGAAALSAMGALRIGAGLVYLGVPQPIYAIEAGKLLEPIVFPLPDQEGCFSESAILEIERYLPNMDAVLVGPGVGISDGTALVTQYILKNFNGCVILDADGINVLQAHTDILRGRTSPTILTPHEGEFRRIGGSLEHGRIDGAIGLAKELGAIIVLKGHKTVITDGEEVFVNNTGNPGMAVGGSGDVLAGMITGLVGQGITPLDAAACGVWLHGAAGDICAQELGQYGMLPSDMLNVLPRLLKQVGCI